MRRRKVRLTYTNALGDRSVRSVAPWGLVDKDDIWYLIAGTERGQRTFRVDRIAEVEATEETAERPDDFALDRAWSEVVGAVEQKRSGTWATVLIETRYVPILRDHFGHHCHIDTEFDDGRSRVLVAAPTPRDIARNLAGWGGAVEVLDPATVQEELARIGTELTRRYAG